VSALPIVVQPSTATRAALAEALKDFGFATFRPGQAEAIELLLERGRLLLVAPTGGGKSLTYQLPAAILPGTTIVISPLVALMQDQVASLARSGVRATFLAATLGSDDMRRRMAAIAQGAFKLVYVAPERLVHGGFRSLVHKLEVPLLAVDEAHCISEWGHDFRPEYLQIGEFVRELSAARVLACTATATPVVRDEILSRLGLPPDTPQVLRGFARPNLSLRVEELRSPKDRQPRVDALLAEAVGRPKTPSGTAIVYAPTRKATEEESDRLRESGWRCAAYHAGLDGRLRDRVQRKFMDDDLDVIVATNAFGMGIDRADVRAVAHLAPPGSIEAYYQEVGRAGRDGEPAIGLLLTTPNDVPLRRRLLEKGSEEGPSDPAIIEHKWNLFLELMRWIEGGSCRHDAILRYFGDEAETLHGCGRCDVCTHLQSREPHSAAEVSVIVQKALSGVARVHGRFGLMAASHLLRGTTDPRIVRAGLDKTRTFGVLAEHSEAWIVRLLRRCVTAGWVDFHGSDHPVVFLTEDGKAVMKGQRPAKLLLPASDAATPRASTTTATAPSSETAPAQLDATALAVFEALRQHRLERSRSDSVPPYVVASDRTLREIAMLRPRTRDELALAHGIGPAKLERYGEGFLAVVARSLADRAG
jgi:ATP-dependent DNA helicase RecQ